VIALVLAMVWSRRGQALILALLTLFGVAAAVAAPAYLRAADRAVAAGQVRAAPPEQRAVALAGRQDDARGGGTGSDVDLDSTGSSLVGLPGFDYVYSREFPSLGLEKDEQIPTRFVYRQFVCAHVRITAGRCLIGEGDVVVGSRTAARLRLVPGQSITLTYGVFVTGQDANFWKPDGRPKKLLVAGVYEATEPDDVYWQPHGYFVGGGEPVFVGNVTFASTDHGATQVGIDGYGSVSALGVDRLPAIRAGLTGLDEAVRQSGAGLVLTTGIPALLQRIDAGRQAAHRIVPVLAVCLVLLTCLTIYLAVGYGTEGRRPELAVVALRGARFGQRWWLATGESLVAIVAGAVAGCVAGQLLVNAFAAWRFPGVGADPGLGSLRWAPVAAAAVVLTALLAQRRQVATPVAELLRRAPVVPGTATAIAFELVLVVLAAVAAVQLATGGGDLRGVGTFATALVLVGAALLAARLLLPWAAPVARRALGRGRVGVALAGFQLFRRPGAVRLFGLLTAAVAVAAYAAYAVDVGAQGRADQAVLGTGATRVLTVGPVGRQGLLNAVRAVDPAGDFGMAAVRLPDGSGLAVDATRLDAVASWPGDGPSRRSVARALRPSAPAAVRVPGSKVEFDITTTDFGEGRAVTITAVLNPLSGLSDEVLLLGVLRNGRGTYGREVPACAQGCTLNSLRVAGGTGSTDVAGHIVVHAITGVDLAATPWRATKGGTAAAGPDGLRIDVSSLNGLPEGMFVQPADTPLPVPVVTAGRPALLKVSGLDGRDVPVRVVTALPVVPGVGAPATLIDLDFADRVSTDGTQSTHAEVWLGPRAPADAARRLTEQGLVITADTAAGQVRRQLDQQGPALALWFFVLVAVLAVALAAGALVLASAVDRTRRIEDLSALRGQGLGRAPLRQATLWTYPVLVAAAVPTGIAIALLGWAVTGWALPLAGLNPPPFPLPGWPRPLVVLLAGAVMLLVLAGVALATGRRTLRSIR
jgi:putative ABC transport system permease protein